MADTTKIEWCDITWNLWRGCTPVSRACVRCYAMAQARRNPAVLGRWGKGVPRVLASGKYQLLPFLWNRRAASEEFRVCERCGDRAFRKPIREGVFSSCRTAGCAGAASKPARPRVFAFSFADWLDDEVEVKWLATLLDTIRKTQELDWLLLSKRPRNWRTRLGLVRDLAAEEGRWDLRDFISQWLESGSHHPPENVWVGATVENQATAVERLPHLLGIPARIRFLSCEPLSGVIDFLQASNAWTEAGMTGRDNPWSQSPVLDGIHWIIAGGETGPGSEPSHPCWHRILLAQALRHKVPFLFKQRGDWSWVEQLPDGTMKPELPVNWREFPDLYRCIKPDGTAAGEHDARTAEFVVRVGRKKAGRTLDGRRFDGYPPPLPPMRAKFAKL